MKILSIFESQIEKHYACKKKNVYNRETKWIENEFKRSDHKVKLLLAELGSKIRSICLVCYTIVKTIMWSLLAALPWVWYMDLFFVPAIFHASLKRGQALWSVDTATDTLVPPTFTLVQTFQTHWLRVNMWREEDTKY